jgi:uncharacterized protein (DUF302 family)
MTDLSDDNGLVSVQSVYPFDETVQRLLAAFAQHGLKVFATIDQAAEAEAVGLTMPPTMLLIFGNARAGTPLMLAQPRAGIDLPLKALVTAPAIGDQVTVSFNTSAYTINRHSLPKELQRNLVPAENLIVTAVTK